MQTNPVPHRFQIQKWAPDLFRCAKIVSAIANYWEYILTTDILNERSRLSADTQLKIILECLSSSQLFTIFLANLKKKKKQIDLY